LNNVNRDTALYQAISIKNQVNSVILINGCDQFRINCVELIVSIN